MTYQEENNIMKKLKRRIALLPVLGLSLMLTACGGNQASQNNNYADGTYSGRSSDFQEDESGNGAGYGEVQIEVKDNKVVSCTFTLYELDGKVKDESYGADLSKENRLKAQKAVQSAEKYAELLVSKGTLDGIDAISGATISYNEFVEAVNNALGKAVKK